MARKKKQTTDQPEENLDNTDDTFGLPEVQYEPLKRDEPEKVDEPEQPEEPPVVINEVPQTPEPEPTVEQPSFQFKDPEPAQEEPRKENVFEESSEYEDDHQPYQPTYSYQRDEPSVWPKVIGLLAVLLIAGLAVWYFAFEQPRQQAQAEKERRELLAIQEEARKKEDERLAAIKRAEEEQKNAAAQVTAAPAEGAIETLSGRSGRYYVIIASSIDGDLIMDYAKKLSDKGVSTKIIPPFGRSRFHRLAVAEGDTYETTQATADGLKGGEYGDKVWVVKY